MPSAPLSMSLPQVPPSLHSPLQCCRWRLSGGCTHSLQHKAVESGEATHRSTCLSDNGGSHSWVPLPPLAAPKALGCQKGTSDDRASRFVLGQSLWVAFAVLVQVKAAGIDSRAGGGKAEDCDCHSGTTRAEEDPKSALPTHPQGSA